MYKMEKKDFGYKLTFADIVPADEMMEWIEESETELASAAPGFGVFVDMRTLKPLSTDAQIQMQEGQRLYKRKGMERSVVILDSALIKMQFIRIAKETGIYEWERYIDASSVPEWEKAGIDWIKKGIDPDHNG